MVSFSFSSRCPCAPAAWKNRATRINTECPHRLHDLSSAAWEVGTWAQYPARASKLVQQSRPLDECCPRPGRKGSPSFPPKRINYFMKISEATYTQAEGWRFDLQLSLLTPACQAVAHSGAEGEGWPSPPPREYVFSVQPNVTLCRKLCRKLCRTMPSPTKFPTKFPTKEPDRLDVR
jgi:hypothetical protein